MNVLLFCLIFLFPLQVFSKESTCFGSTSNGRIENAVNLPAQGKNFVAYNSVARLAGRTYVHSAVSKIIIDTYKSLEIEQPKKVYKYAETGFKDGGEFKPHHTHRNGLSADFMTPVIDKRSKSVHLPTTVFNKFGYNIEFDSDGFYKGLKIDYEAMAAHIVFLHKHAKLSGFGIWRVIFDPDLQPYLFKTQYADYLKEHVRFSTKRSWVRHDEHYHVDFQIPCK